MATKTLSVDPVASKSLIQRRVADFIPILILGILLLVMLFPVGIVTLNSFKTEAEYNTHGPFSLPQTFTLESIQGAWNKTDYTTKLVNSIVISLATAILAIVLSLLNAFALGIGRVRGRAFLIVFFLLAITLPNESLAYPLYYFFKQIKLYDNRWSVILVSAAFHSAYGTYLLSSVLRSFNRELLEAAMIDGCTKLQLLLRIVVPLTTPALSILFVFFFIWTWNDFFLPLIFLISNGNQTVPLALAAAQGERGVIITRQSAVALLGILPCIIFFVLFQRTLARGITAGSMK